MISWKRRKNITVLRSRNYRRFQILRLKDSRHHWGKSLNSGQYSPGKIKTVVSTPHLPHFQESSHHGKVCRSFRFRDIIASQGKGRISKLCCVLLQTRTSSSRSRRRLGFPWPSIRCKVACCRDRPRGRCPWTRQQGLIERDRTWILFMGDHCTLTSELTTQTSVWWRTYRNGWWRQHELDGETHTRCLHGSIHSRNPDPVHAARVRMENDKITEANCALQLLSQVKVIYALSPLDYSSTLIS